MAAIDKLDLDKASVRANSKGVELNGYLQSVSNPAVYAAGDAAASSGPRLTPVASLEAKVVAVNILEGNRLTPDYTGVPSAVFTIPELARVGLTETEAKAMKLNFECKFSDMAGWFSTRRVGETHAAAKVLVEMPSGRILGAHILGPRASEIINFFGFAMRTGLNADDLRNFVSAYPSEGSNISSII